MKKTIAACAVVAVCGTGGFFANNLMIDKVAQEVASQTEQLALTANDHYADVQVIDSKVDGKNVSQRFAIYLKHEGERIPFPLYINHDATVSQFGTKVDGQLTLPKEKGLSAEFIKGLTTFNEDIHYSLTTYNKSINLRSSIKLGLIEDGPRSELNLGEITFNLVGTSEDNQSQFTINTIDFTKRSESIHIGEIAIETVISPELQSSLITVDKGRWEASKGGISVRDIKLKTEAIVSEQTSLHYDWSAGQFDLNARDINLSSSKFGLQGSLGGFSTKMLVDLRSALESNNTVHAGTLFRDVLGNGFALSDINLYFNESNVTGHITFNKADYSALRDYQIREVMLGSALNTELDVIVTPAVMDKFKLRPKSIQKFWLQDENTNYTTKLKVALGKATLNGASIN